MEQINTVTKLIACYKKLPSVGNKTAERLAYATLGFSKEDLDEFIQALNLVQTQVHKCPRCGMYIDTPFCPICDSKTRDNSKLMVLSSTKAVLAFEKTNQFNGKYFVLGGSISPIKGIKAEDIRIPELVDLVKKEHIEELIVALDSNLEGEITAHYIFKALAGCCKITKLAYGLPVGADLEYVDQQTIELSLKDRKEMKGD